MGISFCLWIALENNSTHYDLWPWVRLFLLIVLGPTFPNIIVLLYDILCIWRKLPSFQRLLAKYPELIQFSYDSPLRPLSILVTFLLSLTFGILLKILSAELLKKAVQSSQSRIRPGPLSWGASCETLCNLGSLYFTTFSLTLSSVPPLQPYWFPYCILRKPNTFLTSLLIPAALNLLSSEGTWCPSFCSQITIAITSEGPSLPISFKIAHPRPTWLAPYHALSALKTPRHYIIHVFVRFLSVIIIIIASLLKQGLHYVHWCPSSTQKST